MLIISYIAGFLGFIMVLVMLSSVVIKILRNYPHIKELIYKGNKIKAFWELVLLGSEVGIVLGATLFFFGIPSLMIDSNTELVMFMGEIFTYSIGIGIFLSALFLALKLKAEVSLSLREWGSSHYKPLVLLGQGLALVGIIVGFCLLLIEGVSTQMGLKSLSAVITLTLFFYFLIFLEWKARKRRDIHHQ